MVVVACFLVVVDFPDEAAAEPDVAAADPEAAAVDCAEFTSVDVGLLVMVPDKVAVSVSFFYQNINIRCIDCLSRLTSAV